MISLIEFYFFVGTPLELWLYFVISTDVCTGEVSKTLYALSSTQLVFNAE